MSYASVAAHNAPPPSQQPRADPALLNTETSHEVSAIADDTAKVGVVSQDFKEHPATVTSEAHIVNQYPNPSRSQYSDASSSKDKAKSKAREVEKKAENALHKAAGEGFYLWNLLRDQLLRPGVAGGLLGVVNLGVIGGAGYAFYTHPHLRRDTRAVGSTVAGALALLSAEGYYANEYRKTPKGKEEERRAREEGALIYRHAREHVLRPGVLGGLIGIANVGIIGAIGYLAYTEWDRRTWDRRYVSAISVGLLALWSGEGYLAEQYREGKIQPPRP
jgi:hypothetical protein